jgi:hypothetical protein
MARKPIDEQIRESEERLKQLKAKAAQQAARERAALKAKARQEDTRRKIQHGGLVVLAGLAELDKGTLLGLLLDAADTIKSGDEALMNRAKHRGDQLLITQAATNDKSAAAQTQD